MSIVPPANSISLEVTVKHTITLAVVIPMKTVMERPIREVDQRSLLRTTVILAVLQQEEASWILFSAVVLVVSRIIVRRNVVWAARSNSGLCEAWSKCFHSVRLCCRNSG